MGLCDEDGGKRDVQKYDLIGAAMAVHSESGCGFLESVYQAGYERELQYRNIPYVREKTLPVRYRGEVIGEFRADFVCFGKVIVELKALHRLSGTEESQVINYLKANGLQRGLLINFGASSLDYRRFAHNLR